MICIFIFFIIIVIAIIITIIAIIITDPTSTTIIIIIIIINGRSPLWAPVNGKGQLSNTPTMTSYLPVMSLV